MTEGRSFILIRNRVILLRSTPLLYHIRKVMTYKRVLQPIKEKLYNKAHEPCVLARIWLW